MRGKRISIALLIVAVLPLLAFAQENEIPVYRGPYLGQKPPGMFPEIFAPGVVSTGGFEHSKLEFAKDGSALYWAAQPEGGSSGSLGQRIWFVKKDHDVWTIPERLPVAQLGVRSPTVFPVDNTLFFIGSDDTAATDAHQLKDDLFEIDQNLTKTRKITDRFPMLKVCWSFSFAANGNLYYDHPDGDTYDIYCLEYLNGAYGKPVKLNASINDGNTSVHPFISPDESYLIFSSFRPEGQGIADLYISFREANSNWTEARNMGDVINTDMLERFPSMSSDGKYLFFTRNKGELSDFYWVDARIIESLRPGK